MPHLSAALLIFLLCGLGTPALSQNRPIIILCHEQHQIFIVHFAWFHHGVEGRNEALSMYGKRMRTEEDSECFARPRLHLRSVSDPSRARVPDESGRFSELYLYSVVTTHGRSMYMLTNRPVRRTTPRLSFGTIVPDQATTPD